MDYEKLSKESLLEIKKEIELVIENKTKDWRHAVKGFIGEPMTIETDQQGIKVIFLSDRITCGKSSKWRKVFMNLSPSIWVSVRGTTSLGFIGKFITYKKAQELLE